MIILFRGGLGNQMFEYAYGVAMQKRGHCVLYDSTYNIGPHREFSLGAFNTNVNFDSRPETHRVSEHGMRFDPKFLALPLDTDRVDGYFQSEKYFVDVATDVQDEFCFREDVPEPYRELHKEIRENNSVFIHVRRGDYVGLQQYHGLVPESYYQEALARVRAANPDCRVYVFSDDPDWCRNTYKDAKVIQSGDKYIDMQLMKSCKHAVIANSTFSWWAAWLGADKSGGMVFAPKKWFAHASLDSTDIIPERWTTLNVLDR
jgi:hypothetical protein